MSTATATKRATLCDADEIRRAWALYIPPGQVTELRALNATVAGENYPRTWSGYFDDCDAFIESALRLRSASGVYFVPNVINPDVLFRCANKIRAVGKDEGTTNGEIIARRWLLIDCDPKRLRGISATEKEHEAAIERAYAIRAALADEGWPEPIIASSGNGAHVTYRIDLPAVDGDAVKNCLLALDQRFSTPQVGIDLAVHNAARIWKLPGSMACKGDNSPQRPWRMARILEAPC